MTIPFERTKAVIDSALFLTNLSDPKVTPGLPKIIRQRAATLLRHYPTAYDLQLTANGWNEPLSSFVFECPFADPDRKFI